MLAALALAACGKPAPPGTSTDAGTADASIDDSGSPDAMGPSPDASTTCATDADCADPHSACDDTTTPHQCACACGYAVDGTGTCSWTGVLANPTFSETSGWSGATFDPTDMQAGLIDPGTAHIDIGSTIRMTQTYCMPRRSRAQPLVASVAYRNTDGEMPAFGTGTAWHYQLQSGSTWETARMCLGLAEYAPESSTGRGAPVTTTFMGNPFNGTPGTTLPGYDLDHVEIMPANAGECPDPGTALDGDGESGGGWISSADRKGTFSIDPGIGAHGSFGIHLHADVNTPGDPETYVEASTELSIPLTGSPALSYYRSLSGVSGWGRVEMWIGGGDASAGSNVSWENAGGDVPAAGDATAGVEHLCIPATMRGGVVPLAIRLGHLSNVVAADAIFDDFAIVDDPACGTDAVITDPSFDSPYRVVGAYDATLTSQIKTAQDASLAHTGSGVLVLQHSATCSTTAFSSFIASVSEPPPAAAGAALAYYYNVPASTNWTLLVESPVAPAPPIQQDGGWHRGIVCLPPLPVGHDEQISFGIDTKPAGNCKTTFTAYIDDLSLTTDPSCPTM